MGLIGLGLRDKRVAASCVILMFAFFCALVAATVPDETAAGLDPKPIMGYVYDTMSVPIPGADVTVVSKNGATPVRTLYDTTDADGLYFVTFDPADWEVGYTFEVTATFEGESGSNSVVATGDYVQYCDVTISIVIPEFGAMAGLSGVGLSACLVAVIVLVSRRARST